MKAILLQVIWDKRSYMFTWIKEVSNHIPCYMVTFDRPLVFLSTKLLVHKCLFILFLTLNRLNYKNIHQTTFIAQYYSDYY
jgi:hypothetical protein